MTKPNRLRASDQALLVQLDQADFVKRKLPKAVAWMYHISLWGMVVPASTAVIVYYNAIAVSLMFIITGSVLLGVGLHLNKVRDALKAAQVLNAMFSSILRRGSAFVAIAEKNGALVYVNQGFQRLFPDFVSSDERTVAHWLSRCSVGKTEAEQVQQHMQSDTATMPITLQCDGESKSTNAFKLHFTAIERPTGFIMLRGEAV